MQKNRNHSLDGILNQKLTRIFIFIPKITPKNKQDLNFFLQQNNFTLERNTKNKQKKAFNSISVNANFFLENNQDISTQELQKVIKVLTEFTKINGIFFKNQFLNFERLSKLNNQVVFSLLEQINSLSI
jgi:hypothetical protein